MGLMLVPHWQRRLAQMKGVHVQEGVQGNLAP